MNTRNSPSLSPTVLARMPYFWWRRQAWPQRSAHTPSATRADDAYIPSGTTDLWRSARPQLSR